MAFMTLKEFFSNWVFYLIVLISFVYSFYALSYGIFYFLMRFLSMVIGGIFGIIIVKYIKSKLKRID